MQLMHRMIRMTTKAAQTEVTDQDVKVALALGGGKSHEAPVHPAMVGSGQNKLEVGSALGYGIGSAIGSGT
jgi:hypothetical protein